MAFYDTETRILHGIKTPQIYHPYASLGEVLIYHFGTTPSKVTQVCADDGIEITCQEMADMMIRFAKNLIKLGFKFGDVVGFVGRNVTYATPAIFGCYLLGCPTNPLDSFLNSAEIASTFGKTTPRIIFCDADTVGIVQEAINMMKCEVKVVSLTDKINGLSHISEYFVDPGSEYEIPRNSFLAAEIVATIQKTTGTTEEPKLAMVSHAQLLHKLQWFSNHENVFGFSFSIYSWIICTCLTVSAVLNYEKRLISTSPFDVNVFFDLLEKYKITHFTSAPGHYRLLMESPRYETTDFSSIKSVTVGGWHVPEELRVIMKSKITNGQVKVVGGMTELGGIFSATDDANLISSVTGQPAENTQIKILMEDGTLGSINDIGEVVIKRPDRFLGYWNNPEATKKAVDVDGWFYTGDVGFFDNELNVTLIGRKAFTIRQLNRMFQPSELEDLIEKVEGNNAVCVVSVPHIGMGELATAMVYKDPNSSVCEDMVHDSIKHLEDNKQLLGGVFFVKEIALTISGKVKRNVMKEIAAAMYANKQLTRRMSTELNNEKK